MVKPGARIAAILDGQPTGGIHLPAPDNPAPPVTSGTSTANPRARPTQWRAHDSRADTADPTPSERVQQEEQPIEPVSLATQAEPQPARGWKPGSAARVMVAAGNQRGRPGAGALSPRRGAGETDGGQIRAVAGFGGRRGDRPPFGAGSTGTGARVQRVLSCDDRDRGPRGSRGGRGRRRYREAGDRARGAARRRGDQSRMAVRGPANRPDLESKWLRVILDPGPGTRNAGGE